MSDAVTDAPDDARPDARPATEPELESLDPRVVRLWRLHALWRGLTFVAAPFLLTLLFDVSVTTAAIAAAAVAVLAAAGVAVWPRLQYRAWGYTLRPTDLLLRYGVLFRTTSIVPHARIQHVDTRHGPVDRWLGLETVVVYTAGVRGAMIPIPGLAADRAESLRDRLVELSGSGDAV